jgi:hypothetical protein
VSAVGGRRTLIRVTHSQLGVPYRAGVCHPDQGSCVGGRRQLGPVVFIRTAATKQEHEGNQTGGRANVGEQPWDHRPR